MRYLNKNEDSAIIKGGWQYSKTGQRGKIRETLLNEQKLGDVAGSFCAYSEAFMRPIDSANIEHFDDRKKGKSDDDYWNWYAVLGFMNFRKPRIEKYLPVLCPYDESLRDRNQYHAGEFSAADPEDAEATNLIELLGWNDPTLADYRRKHISRMKDDRKALFDNDEDFVHHMHNHPENLSFITALEAELCITLT